MLERHRLINKDAFSHEPRYESETCLITKLGEFQTILMLYENGWLNGDYKDQAYHYHGQGDKGDEEYASSACREFATNNPVLMICSAG